MNKRISTLALASVALFAAFGAHADEADASQFAIKFDGARTRAEVQAEAVTISATQSFEPAGSRVAAPVVSTINRDDLRTQTIAAVRAGEIPHGEAGSM